LEEIVIVSLLGMGGGGWDGQVNEENVEIHCALYLIDKSKRLVLGNKGMHRRRSSLRLSEAQTAE
jgi:hypothetical protein